jgi:hypothetical protein
MQQQQQQQVKRRRMQGGWASQHQAAAAAAAARGSKAAAVACGEAAAAYSSSSSSTSGKRKTLGGWDLWSSLLLRFCHSCILEGLVSRTRRSTGEVLLLLLLMGGRGTAGVPVLEAGAATGREEIGWGAQVIVMTP